MWKNNESTGEKKLPGMRSRLIWAFAIFGILAISGLWLIQTFWMDEMYEAVKHRELDRCADRLERVVGTDRLEDTVLDLASEYSVCISVHEIRDQRGNLLIEQHTNALCLIHNMFNPTMLNRLYYAALEKEDGTYTEEISIGELFQSPREPIQMEEPAAGEKESAAIRKSGTEAIADQTRSLVYTAVFPGQNCNYMVTLDTELVPLASTVSTLQLQIGIFTLLLAVLAVAMAVLVSSRFSRPLTNMCTEANKLSMGSYNVNFDGGNCRETAQLSAALNRAAYELSQLDKMQKDLIANISHDLRTPLTMISGYSEVIRDLPGEATPENMQVIIDEASRLTSLVNDMLEVSRYQSGTQILHPALFNFTACIRDTIHRYAKLRATEGYSFHLEADRDVWVEADETRILQVLYNLVGNAVNYTGEDRTVTIRQTVLEDEVILSVIDTGAGIPQDQLPLVWERYYKVHDFHKRANMGTGLGLSIVKNILVLHGARFGVNSQVGRGSEFWFALKLADAPSYPETE